MSTTSRKPRIVVIAGPTASGKTALAIKIAKKFNGEIVSADSRQVYKGMDIGTGKVTKRGMRGVPHHLLDVASPKTIFTVRQYQRLARQAVEEILAKNKTPIIVGGTGFYLDALLYNYALPTVPPNPELRKKLERRSADELFRELEFRDPRRAKTIDRHNKRQLVRALEIILSTKQAVPPADTALAKKSDYEILKIGIRLPGEKLKKNIGTRLRKRLRQGMIAEVKRLRSRGVSSQRLDDLGLEYRFVNRYLSGLLPKKEMARLLERAIAQYARRQMTWFRKDKKIKWIKNEKAALALVKKFLTQ